MHGLLKRYILLNVTISDEKLDVIVSCFKPFKAKRGSRLVGQGDVCNKLFFVTRGCLKVYYLSEQGNDRSRFFAFEGMCITSLASFVSGEPSFEVVEVLEDAELLAITREDFFRLADTIPKWKDLYCRLLESAYIHNSRIIESLVILNAKERYQQLLAQNPRVVQRLPNKVVASYLDISPETLSRLKSA